MVMLRSSEEDGVRTHGGVVFLYSPLLFVSERKAADLLKRLRSLKEGREVWLLFSSILRL